MRWLQWKEEEEVNAEKEPLVPDDIHFDSFTQYRPARLDSRTSASPREAQGDYAPSPFYESAQHLIQPDSSSVTIE